MFTLAYYDGRSGMQMSYKTFSEAKRAGDAKWTHLTDAEKERYTEFETGAFFAIFEGCRTQIDGEIAYDYAEEFLEA